MSDESIWMMTVGLLVGHSLIIPLISSLLAWWKPNFFVRRRLVDGFFLGVITVSVFVPLAWTFPLLIKWISS